MKRYIKAAVRALINPAILALVAAILVVGVTLLILPPGSMTVAVAVNEPAASHDEAFAAQYVAFAAPEPTPVVNERVVAPRVIADEPEQLYTDAEHEAVALTLAGECWDDQPEDKHNVAWVVCNRIAAGYGSDAYEVVSDLRYSVQFVGYWEQSREVSDNDREIAAEVLTAYYNGEPAPHDYLFFNGGGGRVNVFK